MVLISITIPLTLREKLAKEDNQSGLIARLLQDHYSKAESPEILELRKKKILHDADIQAKEIDQVIIIKKREVESIESDKEAEIEKREQDIERAVHNAKVFLAKTMTKKQAIDYVSNYAKTLTLPEFFEKMEGGGK